VQPHPQPQRRWRSRRSSCRPACRSTPPLASTLCQTQIPIATHRPLGHPQLHLSSPLGGDPLVIFERAADDARGDRNVAVVAAKPVNCLFRGVRGRRNVRKARCFPGECHCDGWRRVWVNMEVWRSWCSGCRFKASMLSAGRAAAPPASSESRDLYRADRHEIAEHKKVVDHCRKSVFVFLCCKTFRISQ
jgi:hypothetical protein